MVVTRCCGRRNGQLFNEDRVLDGDDKNVLEVDGGDGCITM